MAPLVFDTALDGAGDAVIALAGELDLSGAPTLDDEIGRLVELDGIARVVLDLRGLEFMDSSGLRVVALADRRLSAARRGLVLIRGNETIQRVFEITRMEERLTFVDSPALLDGQERPS